MSTYSFKVKKGKFQIDVSTSDSEMISKQFELWVAKAGAYAKKQRAKECKNLVESQIKAEEKITQKNIEQHLAKHPVPELPKVDENKELKKDNSIKNKVLIDNNTDKNLDIFYTPPSNESISAKIKNSVGGVFDNILESSMNNSKTELTFKTSPSIQKDNAFLNYISSRKIEKKIDYLLLTAYYFTQYEQKPRFTLKQLNAKLMQNIAVIIDHSVLQEAINRDYIECLPDLTGLVGSSEYRLTAYGEKVLLDD